MKMPAGGSGENGIDCRSQNTAHRQIMRTPPTWTSLGTLHCSSYSVPLSQYLHERQCGIGYYNLPNKEPSGIGSKPWLN